MLWIKALHIIFMVTWFAGLFYLPRLFVYHSMSNDNISCDRFKIMQRKLYYGIMAPGALFTIGSGLWLLHSYAWVAYKSSLWLHAKLGLVVLLVLYHLYCGYLIKQFKHDNNKFSHGFYRWFNEFPVLILFAVVILVVVKPLFPN
ncbi:MAG: TIGR00701 family protein [Legionellales bacterium]|nr:MAG: TIGR00701 family protein [Legionellales bacterium]